MNCIYIGLDVGSTTVKVTLVDDKGNLLYSKYERHFSQTRIWVSRILTDAIDFVENTENLSIDKSSLSYSLTLSGSGAIALAEELGLGFVQEVIASTTAIQECLPQTDVCIELGGEDGKIIFLTNGIEQRMNEACAGGTGAFIDQMAEFLHTDATGLNTLAKNYKIIYPIASRCGVFAKTDILPLLNEGSAKEDIAASIFQAVVDQVIGGLACGREIKGNVLFLGGPLTFLDMLRQRFIETLKLESTQALFPENSQYYVALGAAYYAMKHEIKAEKTLYSSNEIKDIANVLLKPIQADRTSILSALFTSDEERKAYLHERATSNNVEHTDFSSLSGDEEIPLYLGIDAGSTTIKAALLTEKNELVYSYYASHKGEPLNFAVEMLNEIYAQMPANCNIIASGATGYGAALLKEALKLTLDEVETLAHFNAARFFLPEVSYILDIGGQDIKCMQIGKGMVQSIKLNEACSAGCGSFIETFAKSLNISLEEFIDAAEKAQHPVDLGTRCTVFMNSKVKQAQKEGTPLGDIAAGLSYSVVKNALYKVIRIATPEELGDHVMVQGGAFYNTALLRALEITLGRKVTRMDISGLMGAYGVALMAKEKYLSLKEEQEADFSALPEILSREEIKTFKVENSSTRCKGCTNHCVLTITKLADGKRIISGNRCDKGAGKIQVKESLDNLYDYKYKRLFDHYIPHEKSTIGTVGMPRVLNMYENYPFWFAFFHTLGFRVEISDTSSKKLYNLGISTIPSQALCYPTKLAHGHIYDLINKKVDFVFYPCLPYEHKEFGDQDDSYNCPVVQGYPELIYNNISVLRENSMPYYAPFLSFDRETLHANLSELAPLARFSKEEISKAIDEAFQTQKKFKEDIEQKGAEIVASIKLKNQKAIVLAGHPYHIDPEINHGIPELINSMGLAVLTEDSISYLSEEIPERTFVDQWTYHARLYRAAHQVTNSPSQLAFVQLVSFGCGLDAITAEQSEEILTDREALYTQIKIDEGFNLGAARIRIRSLLAVMNAKEKQEQVPLLEKYENVYDGLESLDYPAFTKEMVPTHTLLIPQMAPLHFPFLESSLQAGGYKAHLLTKVPREAIEMGLKYVNNDACYPAITVIGQFLHAVKEEGWDKDKVGLLITQTGGGCRATNYVGFLRKALNSAGLENVPIVTFNLTTNKGQTGFAVDLPLFVRLIQSILFGDVLMRVLFRTRPYEKVKGSADALAEKWTARMQDTLKHKGFISFYKNVRGIIKEFDALELTDAPRRPRVGLVGEILLKYHPDANNRAVEVIEEEGGEVVMPDMLDFFSYNVYGGVYNHKTLGTSKKMAVALNITLRLFLSLRLPVSCMLSLSKRFHPAVSFRKLKKKVQGIVSLGQQTGEGWLLTAEMVELIEDGVTNVLCMQPFGCLPNHITGRGVIKELKRRYPHANITAVDYDASTSETNQINRIKLIMALAKK